MLGPDALDFDSFTPNVGVPVYALHSIFIGGSIMDNVSFNQGMHFWPHSS